MRSMTRGGGWCSRPRACSATTSTPRAPAAGAGRKAPVVVKLPRRRWWCRRTSLRRMCRTAPGGREEVGPSPEHAAETASQSRIGTMQLPMSQCSLSSSWTARAVGSCGRAGGALDAPRRTPCFASCSSDRKVSGQACSNWADVRVSVLKCALLSVLWAFIGGRHVV